MRAYPLSTGSIPCCCYCWLVMANDNKHVHMSSVIRCAEPSYIDRARYHAMQRMHAWSSMHVYYYSQPAPRFYIFYTHVHGTRTGRACFAIYTDCRCRLQSRSRAAERTRFGCRMPALGIILMIIQLIPLPPIARISRHVNFLPIAVRWVPFQRQPPPLFKPHECNPSSYTTRAHCIASHCIRLSHLTLHRSIHRISTKLAQSTTSRVEC
jgi:hypothetical protein